MMKYIYYFLTVILLSDGGLALENQDVEPVKVSLQTIVKGQSGNLEFRSIAQNDAPLVEALISRCTFKEGLTQNSEKDPLAVNIMAQNLIARQESGNPYSGIVLSRENKPVGFITLGVMSALGFGQGYKINEHAGILKIFHKLGALKLQENPNQDAEYASGKYDKVMECGLAMMVPVLPRNGNTLDENEIRSALRIAISVCQTLRDEKKTLPRGENSIPGILMGLFHPSDLLLTDLEAVGFEIIRDEALKGFYGKERVLAYVKLK